MKKNLLLAMLLSLPFLSKAQPTWTWLQGEAYTPGYSIYGIKGQPDLLNRPVNRSGQVSWKDADGNIWFFGGTGRTANEDGYLNDLWKYSPAQDRWTWMNGDPVINQPGVYGSKGVASARNRVRSRAYATGWMDAEGNMWLYGGRGFEPSLPSSLPVYFNDLWKYSPALNQWTWMGGDTLFNGIQGYYATYGTKGQAAAASKPPSKSGASGWTDTTGNFWLFGGTGANARTLGQMNDLWKFTPATGLWAWISGDTTANQPGEKGTQGTPTATTRPGSRFNSTSWRDNAGNLWLFGGEAASTGPSSSTNYFNELWKYDIGAGQWTYVSGDVTTSTGGTGFMNTVALYSRPGQRSNAVSWTDTANNFYLYGGSNGKRYNDLWNFSVRLNRWTLINGDTIANNRPAVYGQKSQASGVTHPGAGNFTGSWTGDSSRLWLAGNDTIWNFSPDSQMWTWVSGDTAFAASSLTKQKGVYGSMGIGDAANLPPIRTSGSTWKDASGNRWLYGGLASSNPIRYPNSCYSDLWQYNAASNQWTWVDGDSVINKSPVYGTMNVSAPGNTPGALYGAATWSDTQGNLWLFGGADWSSNMSSSTKGDLWKYSPVSGEWTWLATYNYGSYGTQGTAAPSLHPGGRYNAVTWTDQNGNFWLYGGEGFASNLQYNDYGKLNDLWKYSPTNGLWTFVSGDSHTANPFTLSKPGVYGTKGVTASGNKPGGRSGAAGWTDPAGGLWLFGGSTDVSGSTNTGSAVEAFLNDLWRFSPATNQWTWMAGDNNINTKGIYGNQGAASAANQPGSRRYPSAWADKAGNFYLFGGNCDSTILSTGAVINRNLNDTWKYSVASGQWTWISGDSAYNWPGYYSPLGSSSVLNKSGARYGAMSWGDDAGNSWIFGGFGTPVNGSRCLNDLLKFSPASSLPVLFSSFTAHSQSETVILNWTTAQEENSSSFKVERSGDGRMFVSIGTVAAAGNSNTSQQYGYTDLSPLEGDNFYRIREVDKDGKSFLSLIQKIWIMGHTGAFSLLANPVRQEIVLQTTLATAQPVQLQIINAAGRMVRSQQLGGARGSSLQTVDVSSLPPGTYFMRVIAQSMQGTLKFIKL